MELARRLRIKEWAIEDRPREKMLLKGASSLSDTELLAILIGSGNNEETAVQLSQRILNTVSNNLNKLGKLSIKELTSFKGIGKAKAISIAAALELGRRKGVSEPVKQATIQNSQNVFFLFYPMLCDLVHEELWVALVNRAGKVIERVKISQGGTGETSADIQLILKAAINSLCTGLILCHNHPSGSIVPSKEDDQLTFQLDKASRLMNIKLLDHLIIADKFYYSYADENRLANTD